MEFIVHLDQEIYENTIENPSFLNSQFGSNLYFYPLDVTVCLYKKN